MKVRSFFARRKRCVEVNRMSNNAAQLSQEKAILPVGFSFGLSCIQLFGRRILRIMTLGCPATLDFQRRRVVGDGVPREYRGLPDIHGTAGEGAARGAAEMAGKHGGDWKGPSWSGTCV